MQIKQTTMIMMTALALGAPACATKTGTGAAVGAGAGAVIGAGVGAIAGGSKGAVMGGAVGAATGGATGALIGRYMDRQQKELERKVESAKIERQGNELVVKFNSAILFDVDKTDLKAGAKQDLADFSNVLKEYKETNLVIEGHTDNTGSDAHNLDLSGRRAEAVIAFLGDNGVASGRLKAVGYGEEKPAAGNDTAEGRQQNRRVQIQIAANEELKKQDAAQATSPNGQRAPAKTAP